MYVRSKKEFLVIYCEKIKLRLLGSFQKVAAAVNVLTSLCGMKNKRKCQIKCEIKYNKASLQVHEIVNSHPLVFPPLQQTQEFSN